MKKISVFFLLMFSLGQTYSQTVIFDDELYSPPLGFGNLAWNSVGNLNLDKYGRAYISSMIYYGIPGSCCSYDVRKINLWNNSFQYHSGLGIGSNIPYINTNSSFYFWRSELLSFIRKESSLLTIPFTSGFQYKVFVDNKDNLFISNGDSIYKIDSTGVINASFDIDVTYITGDESNNLFIVTDSLRKYDSLGTQLWSYPNNGNIVVVDSISNSYFFNAGILTKLDSSGNVKFLRNGISNGLIAVDKNEYIYIKASAFLYKYNSTADTVIWSHPLSESYEAISVDNNENCYLLGAKNNIPWSSPNGYSGYYGYAYLKILASLPPPDSINITQVSDTIFCSGDSIEVHFDVNGPPNYINSYRLERSNASGSFISGVSVLGYSSGSPVRSVISTFTPSSSNYALRVVPTYSAPGLISYPYASITINKPAEITFDISSPFRICSNYSPVDLNPQPMGGILSGTGIYGTWFYPDSATAPGTYNINYALTDSNGCAAHRNINIYLLLNPVPLVSLYSTSDSICKGDTLHLNGIPAGGFYSGPGITNDIFYSDSTSLLTNLVSYSLISMVSNFACTTSTSKSLYVFPQDPINFNLVQDTVCLTGPPILIAATPTGGILSGDGIYSNTFYPDSAGQGLHTIAYTYVTNDGCIQLSNVDIFVDYCLSAQSGGSENKNITIFPNPVSGSLTIKAPMPLNFSIIQISDTKGRLVYEGEFSGTIRIIDVSKLSDGIYLCKIIMNNEMLFSEKFSVFVK